MKYTDQEKEAIAAKRQEGESIQSLCLRYNISRSTIYRWRAEYRAVNPGDFQVFTIKDYTKLQNEVERLGNIITIMKSVDCTTSSSLREKLAALEPLYSLYNVRTLCEALDVDRGTFYNYVLRGKHGNAWYDKRREEYRVLIRDVFDEFRQVVGSDKIRSILNDRGYQVSSKFVASVMREMGLSSVRTTAKQEYLKLREPEKKKNILRQQFSASRPNEIWVSDVTCFKLKEQYYYICVILDLFSRKVVAHKCSRKNSVQLLTATFRMAIEQRAPDAGLVFHSDRGAQYTSHRFQQLLYEHSVKQSFSNSGKPHDNAVAESFFASLKKEEMYRKNYSSEAALCKGVSSYIEFYNTLRPHHGMKNRTPQQVEALYTGMEAPIK